MNTFTKKSINVFLLITLLGGSPLLIVRADEGVETPVTTTAPVLTDTSTETVTDPAVMVVESIEDSSEILLDVVLDVYTEDDSSATSSLSFLVPTSSPVTTTAVVSTSTESASTNKDTILPFSSVASTSTITPTGSDSQTSTTTTVATATEAVTIQSGDAVATANILNILNTNFINSQGSVQFANFYDYVGETLNFNDPVSSTTCVAVPCTVGNDVTISTKDNGVLYNNVDLLANSGGNTIANSTAAVIETGDAYAGLNLVNLVNTNVVDSNYLIVTINAFNGIGADIIFPSLMPTLNQLSKQKSLSGLSIKNTATSTTNLTQGADTGNNYSGQNSTINTGQSLNTANIHNQINHTSAGGYDVSFIFKVSGAWPGTVFGLPENYSWMEGDDGSLFVFNQNTSSGPHKESNRSTINGNDTALIDNNISVIALTGDNQITGSDTGSITTGNAYAGTNIVNVANSTVIGKNWIIAIVNIFGDFLGNIAFGQPDLWVGGIVDTPARLQDGSSVTYNFTIINNGDLPATKTTLTEQYDTNHIEIISSTALYTTSGDTLTWDIGSLEPGEATEISYTARIKNAGPGTVITNLVHVQSEISDYNQTDNSETITITTASRHSSSRSKPRATNHPSTTVSNLTASLVVERTTKAVTLSPTEFDTAQHLTIFNHTNKDVYDVVLYDELINAHGELLHTETWNLGTVKAYEEINISYTINFSDEARAGIYRVTSFLKNDTTKVHPLAKGTITLLSLPARIPEPIPSTPVTTTEKISPMPLVLGAANSNTIDSLGDASSFWGIPVAEASGGEVITTAPRVFSLGFFLPIIALIALFTTGFYLLILYRNRHDINYQ